MAKKLISSFISFFSICLIVTLGTAVTYLVTQSTIDGNYQKLADKARTEVLPEAEGFNIVDGIELTDNVTEVYYAVNGCGYAVTSVAESHAGEIKVITGLNLDGTVVGIRIIDSGDGSPNNKVLTYNDVYIDALKASYGSSTRIASLISEISGDTYTSSDILGAVSAAMMQVDTMGGTF